MDQGLIPRRYAKAIFEVASERGDQNRLYQLMGNLESAFAAHPALADTVANPFVSNDDKCALLTTAAQAADTDKTFADALKLLAQNRRLDLMRLIARAYCDIYRRRNNIARVTVTSPAQLDPAVEKRIRDLIQAQLGDGSMEYRTQIDPSLIGGFTVQVDNQRLDASLKNELKQLRINLIN